MQSSLSVPEQHRLKIARATLKMVDEMVAVMGSPSREEAAEIANQLRRVALGWRS